MTRSARSRAASTRRGVGLVDPRHPGPRLVGRLAELDVPRDQPRASTGVVERAGARPRRAARGPPASAARRAAGSCPRSRPARPRPGPRSRRRSVLESRARRRGDQHRLGRCGATPAARRTPRRRRSPARPCGRADPRSAARRSAWWKPSIGTTGTPYVEASAAASVDLPAPGDAAEPEHEPASRQRLDQGGDLAPVRRNAGAPHGARPYAGGRMTNAPDLSPDLESPDLEPIDSTIELEDFDLEDELQATSGWEAEDDPEDEPTAGAMELAERHALRRVAGLSHRARGHQRGRVPPAPPRAGGPGRRLDRGLGRGRRELDGRARPARRDRRLRGARGDLPAPAVARPRDVRRPRQGRRASARSSRPPAPTPSSATASSRPASCATSRTGSRSRSSTGPR